MRLYEKELLTEDSYLRIYGLRGAGFNAQQLAVVSRSDHVYPPWEIIMEVRGSCARDEGDISTTYYLQSKDQIEVTNWALETHLWCFSAEQSKLLSFGLTPVSKLLPKAPYWAAQKSKLDPAGKILLGIHYTLVVKQISIAFQLQLPDQAQVHLVFHVSQLMKAFGE
ncbi:Protein RRP6-like 2, partial [Mucuna pruriens]